MFLGKIYINFVSYIHETYTMGKSFICIYAYTIYGVNIISACYLHTLYSHVNGEIPPAGSASQLCVFKGIAV